MRIVAVVPIKMNNRRLPNKNIKKFTEGNPLCYYAISTVLEIADVDQTYVYCSNSDIKKYIPEKAVFLNRNNSLDRDSTSMNDILKSFSHEVEYDICILIHATAPFISKESINKGLNAVLSGKYDSAFSVVKMQDFIWMNGKPLNYDLSNIPRTQDLPLLYKETSGFYIFNRNVLVNDGKRIGDNSCMIEVNSVEAIDIDEEEDFMIADAVQYYKHLFGV